MIEVNQGASAQTPSHPADAPTSPSAPPSERSPAEDVGIASGLQFRVDERYEVEGDAEVVVKSGSLGTTLLRGSILDISATGCFIQTMARVPIKPGTEVQIIFSVYGTTFRVEAMSRFARTRVGIGFRFLEMDPATRQRLHAVLADIRSRLIENDPKATLPVIERTGGA